VWRGVHLVGARQGHAGRRRLRHPDRASDSYRALIDRQGTLRALLPCSPCWVQRIWNSCTSSSHQPGCFRSDDPELRHQCALPTRGRIRRHIFTIGLWHLPEHRAERRARSPEPLVLSPGARARALQPHRQLWRVGLLLDPAELRGCGAGCASVFWAPAAGGTVTFYLVTSEGGQGTPYNTLSECMEARAKATQPAICINR